jgi:hypothetical protein
MRTYVSEEAAATIFRASWNLTTEPRTVTPPEDCNIGIRHHHKPRYHQQFMINLQNKIRRLRLSKNGKITSP